MLYTKYHGRIDKIDTFIDYETSKISESINYGDILFPGSGETIEEIGKASVNLIRDTVFTGGDIVIFTPSENIDSLFLSYILNSSIYRIQSRRLGQGHSVVHIYGKDLEDVIIPVPSIKVQKKIALILSTWDDKLELLKNLLKISTREKKALTSKVYRGLVGKDKQEVAFNRLRKHIREVLNRNIASETNNVLSVSNSRGFIPQSQQFDREVASKNKEHYKIISKHQFAYNPSRVNVGSIDLLEEFDKGLLSPMYVVFECLQTIN
jgi:type I restriction enzyme S subunit